MAEKVLRTITAGNSPVYEIVDVDEGTVRIRVADNPDKYIDLIPSVLPTLSKSLQDVWEEMKREEMKREKR